MEDDSIEGSYCKPIKEKYRKIEVKKTIHEQMIDYIKSRKMTNKMDLYKKFGISGNSKFQAQKILDDVRIIKKTCKTGRCSWYEYIDT